MNYFAQNLIFTVFMAYAQFSSPEALYGTMFMEISKLSPRERHIILDVMLRDENLRRKDEHRVR